MGFRGRFNGGRVCGGGEVRGGGQRIEDAAVEGERDLDFGLVRVAVYQGSAGGEMVFGAHGW